MKSTRRVLGHSLVCSLVRSHLQLIPLALHSWLHSRALLRFAALCCALLRSLTRARAHGKELFVEGMNAWISYRFIPLCSASASASGASRAMMAAVWKSIYSNGSRLSTATFARAFPFHVVFDRNLKVGQMGVGLRKALGEDGWID